MEAEDAGEEIVQQNEDVGTEAAVEIAKVETAVDVVKTDEEIKAESLEQEIETWFREHFHNSIVSADVAIINHVRAAVDSLKAKLKQYL